MLVYSSFITARLQYVCGFIGKELSGSAFQVTDKKDEFISFAGPKINYSAAPIGNEGYWMQPHSLLFEQGVKEQTIDCFEINGYKAFFKTGGDHPFDLFAANFYLLSRYEEYLPHQKDEYGRYAYQNSLAYRNGFLKTPLVNIWLRDLSKQIQIRFSEFKPEARSFHFIPTYDIDEAYSYKHKGFLRTSGAVLKALLKGNWKLIGERKKVLAGKQTDPFDSYDWMDSVHREFKLAPRYFFLVADRTGKYDRNILPREPALKELIRVHSRKYPVGVHPSWQSGDRPELLKKELATVKEAAGTEIISSRQHFIRFSLPETYRLLFETGIREEFSMGYGSINGFRASVASSFYWYDLEREKTTDLLIYPFCYMEANSFFEQKLSPEQSLDEMRHYYIAVKEVGGMLITVWHNTFLGTAALFKGWKEAYVEFLKEMQQG